MNEREQAIRQTELKVNGIFHEAVQRQMERTGETDYSRAVMQLNRDHPQMVKEYQRTLKVIRES
jgi:hypothetical protein